MPASITPTLDFNPLFLAGAGPCGGSCRQQSEGSSNMRLRQARGCYTSSRTCDEVAPRYRLGERVMMGNHAQVRPFPMSLFVRLLAQLVVLALLGLAIAGTALAASGDELWSRTYHSPSGGPSRATAATVDPPGNVVVTGNSYRSSTGADILTVKYTPWGALRWTRRFTGPGRRSDAAYDVACDSAGNVYATGRRMLPTGPSLVVLKYDAAGNRKWVAGLGAGPDGAAYGKSLVVATRGEIYVAGVRIVARNNNDIVALKYTAAGRRLWTRRYDGPAHREDGVNDMARDGGNNVYLAGAATVSGRKAEFLVLSYAPDGRQRWDNIPWGAGSTATDSAGAVVVGGGYVGATGNKGKGCLTVCYTTGGALRWTRSSGQVGMLNAGTDIALWRGKYSVAGTSGEEYLFGVESVDGTGDGLSFVNPVASDAVNRDPHVAVDASGNAYVAGSYRCSPDALGVSISKFSGWTKLWTATRPSPPCEGTDLAIGPRGALYVAGKVWTDGSLTSPTDYLVVKYAQ